jgi:3-deoxy-D-manno-octulosonic acid kinase
MPQDSCAELALPGGAMRYDPRRLAHPGGFLFDPRAPANAAVPVGEGGRQAAWFTQGEYGAAVLRHYRRGGLVARISRDRYVWTGAQRSRSYAEFDLLRYLHARGLPVPAPLAAAWWRSGLTYRAAILIERLPGVTALASTLQPSRVARPGYSSQQAVAAAIHALHRAGVWHADLNAYNILLDPQGAAWLIDFDRGRRGRLTPRQCRGNLLRLRRSLLKVAGERGLAYWQGLEQAYLRLGEA